MNRTQVAAKPNSLTIGVGLHSSAQVGDSQMPGQTKRHKRGAGIQEITSSAAQTSSHCVSIAAVSCLQHQAHRQSSSKSIRQARLAGTSRSYRKPSPNEKEAKALIRITTNRAAKTYTQIGNPTRKGANDQRLAANPKVNSYRMSETAMNTCQYAFNLRRILIRERTPEGKSAEPAVNLALPADQKPHHLQA